MKIKEKIGTLIIGTVLMIIFIVMLIAVLAFFSWFHNNVDPFLLIALGLLLFFGFIGIVCIILIIGSSYWAGNEIYKELFNKDEVDDND